jgi:hypothetical protein
MPALANKTYFNYGGQGPLPTPSLQAITSTWGQIQELGPFTGAVWPLIEGTTSRLRQHLGQWFGVGTHRVAFSENVTTACVLPLWGLPWQEGDELLLSDAEHPGVVAACQELARRQSEAMARLLLLSPAGLTGRPMPVPPLLDALGVRFLAQAGVRRGLCRSAFADPDRDVGPAELEIASLHLASPGWAQALGAFARSGGFAGCGDPLPPQPIEVLWGKEDRILRPPQKRAALALLGDRVQELEACGHLPHIDQPAAVAQAWQQLRDRQP